MKNLENPVANRAQNEMIPVVMAINNTALPERSSRLLAKAIMLLGLPVGTKSSPGSKTMHIPVKLSSNSLALILTSPLAGSLI